MLYQKICPGEDFLRCMKKSTHWELKINSMASQNCSNANYTSSAEFFCTMQDVSSVPAIIQECSQLF